MSHLTSELASSEFELTEGVETMLFDQTLLPAPSPVRTAARVTASFAAQCAAIAVIILVSLAATPALSFRQLGARLITPPPPAIALRAEGASPAGGKPAGLTAPHWRPLNLLNLTQERPIPAPGRVLSGPAPEVSGYGPQPDVFTNLSGTGAPAAPPPMQDKPTATKGGPEPISAGVAEANLIVKVVPDYPRIAVAAHIQGAVRFRAIIGTDGRIRDLEVVSGPPLLIEAAQHAVLAWRYRPTLLSGAPVPVLTEIIVHFTLGSE